MNPLSPTERRSLRALAHHLEPVVTVGHHGLTPAVLHEIDLALLAHDLVKVRVLGDDREARNAMLAQACEALDCAPVQHVGKVLVLWRPNPERKKKAPQAAEPAKSARPTARKRPAQRQPVDPVRERRRAARTPEKPPTGDQSRRRRRTV
jgi:putative YhbY family RNA-binding protein